MLYKRIGAYLTMFILLLCISCGSSKNIPYYKVRLNNYEDYKIKFDKLVTYLKDFDNDAQTICNTVLSDLVIFEEDIDQAVNKDNDLNPYQIDTLHLMRKQVTALRKFMDCLAWCSEYPIIYPEELNTAIDLLGYQSQEIDQSVCSKIIEIKKERYLYYFLINTTQKERRINYAYNTFEEGNDSGFKFLGAGEAAVIFGIFNEYSNDWLIMRSVLCN